MKVRLALIESMGAFDDDTLSDAEWFAKHGNKKEEGEEIKQNE